MSETRKQELVADGQTVKVRTVLGTDFTGRRASVTLDPEEA